VISITATKKLENFSPFEFESGMGNPGDFSIEVFSITGQKIKQETLTNLSPGRNIKKIAVSDLSQGLYFVKLSNPNYTITKKFILSK
jgi:hypothetical protein